MPGRDLWVVRWFAPDAGGKVKRCQRTFKTRVEAEAFQAQKQTTFDKSPQARRVARKITLGEFIVEFEKLRTGPRGQRLKSRTVKPAVYELNRFARFAGTERPLAGITPADAARFFAAMRGGKCSRRDLSSASINKAKGALKAAFCDHELVQSGKHPDGYEDGWS